MPSDNETIAHEEENSEITVLDNIDHGRILQEAQKYLENLKKRMQKKSYQDRKKSQQREITKRGKLLLKSRVRRFK